MMLLAAMSPLLLIAAVFVAAGVFGRPTPQAKRPRPKFIWRNGREVR